MFLDVYLFIFVLHTHTVHHLTFTLINDDISTPGVSCTKSTYAQEPSVRFDIDVQMYKTFFTLEMCGAPRQVSNGRTYISGRFGPPLATLSGYLGKGLLKRF